MEDNGLLNQRGASGWISQACRDCVKTPGEVKHSTDLHGIRELYRLFKQAPGAIINIVADLESDKILFWCSHPACPRSGSFICNITGLEGQVRDTEHLKSLCTQTVKQLGWDMQVSSETQLQDWYTKEFLRTGQGRSYFNKKVTLILAGTEFNVGITLLNGTPNVEIVSNIQGEAQRFATQGQKFTQHLKATAKMSKVYSTLGVKPQVVQAQSNRILAKVYAGL